MVPTAFPRFVLGLTHESVKLAGLKRLGRYCLVIFILWSFIHEVIHIFKSRKVF